MKKRIEFLASGHTTRPLVTSELGALRSFGSYPLSDWRFIVRVLFTVVPCCLFLAPSAMAQTRGELLYTTHCVSCHTTQMHWRDKRSASDWESLKGQVRRWQEVISLSWSDSDILAVSRYLNGSYYHFEQAEVRALLMRPAGKETAPGPTHPARLAHRAHLPNP